MRKPDAHYYTDPIAYTAMYNAWVREFVKATEFVKANPDPIVFQLQGNGDES